MKIQRLSILLLLILSFHTGFSQIKEGKVEYSISYLNSDLPKESIGLLPDRTEVWFKNDQSRFDMKMAMGMNMSTIIIQNDLTILMDIMGNKTAFKKELKELNNSDSNKAKTTYSNETKELAGYVCQKANIKSENGDFEIWFTNQISGNNKWNDSFRGIKGFPLEFNMKTGQMEMHLKAIKVVLDNVEDSVFKVPSDYTYLTEEETKSMFEGLK